MVGSVSVPGWWGISLSVLALSSRFDGRLFFLLSPRTLKLSVLALSSRFDGRRKSPTAHRPAKTFSTRSVESF